MSLKNEHAKNKSNNSLPLAFEGVDFLVSKETFAEIYHPMFKLPLRKKMFGEKTSFLYKPFYWCDVIHKVPGQEGSNVMADSIML